MSDEVDLMQVDGDPKLTAVYWQIYDAARRGLDQKQIAQRVGVSKHKLKRWIDQSHELRAMLEQITKDPVVLVEDSLYKRAIGHTEVEESIEFENINGEMIPVKAKKTMKNFQGDVNAQKYILENRSDDWHKNPENESEAEINIHFDPALKDV